MSVPNHISDPDVRWDRVEPAALATQIRLNAVRMIAPQGFGYLGQALSAAEQVAAFFTVATQGRDRLVCSPGHYIIAPLAAGVAVGLLGEDAITSYGQDGSAFEAIGTERTPLFDYTCGSLGQGLSGAAGLVLADRLHGNDARTFAMVSDGELEEGQVWEAALFAAHNRLGRLIVLLDANNSQVDGPVDSITTIEPIAAKWEAFGWRTAEVDGHDVDAVIAAIEGLDGGDSPAVVICRTSTVHGLDCLPSDADGHFIKLPAPLAEAAERELSERLEAGVA